MHKPTLQEVVQKMLTFKGSEKATMLGIGPMSKTLIKACMLLAKDKDFPLMFIASRNQVDADELGGGYVCNWNQETFAKAIKEVAAETNFDGLHYLCRDHGGPWQRDNERNAHLPEDEAMSLGKKSYLYDLINGFDLLHIAPTKDPYIVGKVIDPDVNVNRTVELIEYVETERKQRNLPAISYEVGTEETNGGLTSPENYEKFIQKLHARLDKKGLPHLSFIVGNTGTLTRLTENVGHVDSTSCKELSAVAKKYNVGLKEHNGDYLDDAILLEHPALGVTAMNVAPEFGTVETRAYLKLVEAEARLAGQGLIDKPSELGRLEIGEPHLEQYRVALQKALSAMKLDFIIGSVHNIGSVKLRKFRVGKTADELYSAYFAEILQMVETADFDVIGHLDLVKKYAVSNLGDENFQPPGDYDFSKYEGIFRKILSRAIERGIGIEINTSGWRTPAHEQYPKIEVIKLYRELGGELITIGSDVNHIKNLAEDFKQAEEILRSVGFKKYFHYVARRPYPISF